MTRFGQILEGLKIIHKYDPAAELIAEHDEIYVDSQRSRDQITMEDHIKMGEYGYTFDNGSWRKYV